MRIVLLTALAVTTGCYGGFFSGGAGWHQPSIDENPDNAITGGLVYQAAGGIGFAEDKESWAGFEGWAQFGDTIDIGDLTVGNVTTDIETELLMVGVGVRGLIGENRRLYARLGGTWEDLSGGDLPDDFATSLGIYAGLGYQFYLDSGRHLSIAPEFMLHAQWRDFEDALGAPSDHVFAATGSVVLTYHFGGSKREKHTKKDDPWKGVPPLREDLK